MNEPIQVPNKVLPPGTYVMKLLDSPSDRHIVQIFNADENHLFTTILAIPNYRIQPTGKTVFTFWETPPGQPKALRAWFYPGDNFGQEFAYPKSAAVADRGGIARTGADHRSDAAGRAAASGSNANAARAAATGSGAEHAAPAAAGSCSGS